MIIIALLSLITSTAAGRDYNAQQCSTEYKLPIIVDDAAIRNTISLHSKAFMTEKQKKQSRVFYTEAAALRAKAAAKYPPTAKELCWQLKNFAALTEMKRAARNVVGASVASTSIINDMDFSALPLQPSSTTAGGLTTKDNDEVVVSDNDLDNNQQIIDVDDANPNDRERMEWKKNGDHHNRHNLYERCCEEGSVLAIGFYQRCCKNCNNWIVNHASGFVVSNTGIIATNYHVFDDDDNEAIVLAIDQNLNVYPITKVLAADERFDTALVQLGLGRRTCSSGVVGKELESFPPPLPLANDHASIGSPVTIISHPKGNFFMLTRGVAARYAYNDSPPESKPVIRSSSTQAESGNSCNVSYWLYITADYAIGSSGAPVFNEQGQVVGMGCISRPIYTKNGGERHLQMVLKACVPSSAIVRLLSQIRRVK